MISILHVYDDNDSMAARYVAMLTAALGDSVQSEQASTAAQLKEMASRQPAFDIVHVHGNPAFFCKLIEKADHNAMMCCPQSTQKTQNNSVNSVFSVDISSLFGKRSEKVEHNAMMCRPQSTQKTQNNSVNSVFSVDISSLFGKRSEKADHNVPLDLRSLATKGTQERSSFIVQRSTFNVQRLIITPHGHPLPRVPAYAVVARSPMEHDSLAKQHPHVETVRNPIITRTTTAATCAAQMMRIYQHVANSFLLPLLSPSSRQALATLLCVAIGGDARWAIQPLPTDADYHQLQAYARLEGVLPMVRKGLRLMAVEVPEPEEMDCYLPAGYKVPQRMQGNDIPTLLSDIKTNGPSLLRLCEVAEALHDDNLDEARLLHQLDEHQLRPLMASLLPLLSQQLLLTEGFMPCPPTDDHLSQQLSQQLATRQCPL